MMADWWKRHVVGGEEPDIDPVRDYPSLNRVWAPALGVSIEADGRMLDAVIFNILVCNTDAHAKNHALLLSHGSPRLAPLYDVMCAAAWDGITANLSQAVGGKNRGDHIHGRHWKRQAAACGLNETRVVARVAELVGKVDKALPESVATVEAMPAGGHVLLPRFRDAIAARCARVSRNLDD